MAPATAPKVAIKGKLQILQVDDFHPDHNAFVKKAIEGHAKDQNWPLELSPVAGFLGGTDIYQKLLAVTQAGDPPDLMAHGLSARQLETLKVGESTDDVMQDLIRKHGKVYPGFEAGSKFNNKWWAVPFYVRTGGRWARRDVFKKHGIDIDKDLTTWDQLRDACLKVSEPENKMWGWGMTANRSGDGNTLTQNILHAWGGALTDETGQMVRLNSPQTIAAFRWLAETFMDKKWEKMLPPGVNSWTDPSNNEAFVAGTLAYTSNAGTMYAKAVFDKVPFANEIKVLPVTEGPAKVRLQGAGGHNFYLFKGVRNRDAAIGMITHMLSVDVQAFLWQASPGYVVPAFKNPWEDPRVRKDDNAVRFESITWAEPPFRGLAHPGPLSAAVDAVGSDNVLTDMMGQILKGKKVEDAVKEAHDRATKIFKEFGLKGE